MRYNPSLDEDQNILDHCALEELWGSDDIFIDTADGHIERLHINELTSKPSPPLFRKHNPG